MRPTIISLTVIPPRFIHLPNKIASLLDQSVQPDAIEIYIPKTYRRFAGHQEKIPNLPSSVQIIELAEDLGPATKLLPALKKWKGQDVDILICDDDRLQDRDWVCRLKKIRDERPLDIICERGWNILDRFGYSQETPLLPRAAFNYRQGRTLGYRLKRALSLGIAHPNRILYKQPGYVDVFEGFLGALIPGDAMPEQAWNIPNILWTVDDVWLSGMARLNGVGIWAHNLARPVHSKGRWDKTAALSDWVEEGADRQAADRLCVDHMREQHDVWR